MWPVQLIAMTDGRRRRGPFLAPAEILVLAGMVGALLFLLFPGRDYGTLRRLGHADELSIAMLSMGLRSHPDDEARLELARQQLTLGKLADAQGSLAPLRGRTDDIGHRAAMLGLALDRTRLYALLPADSARGKVQAEVHQSAMELLPATTDVHDLADLADLLLSLGDPGRAATAYQRLATLDRSNAVGWLEKAGHESNGAGNPAQAAKCYGEAALATADRARGLRLAHEALAALLASNQGGSQVGFARPLIERYPSDLALLELGVRIALASGDLATARHWGELRMAAAGSSDAAVREQLEILMQGGDAEGALKLARALLVRVPSDPGLHRRAAQLALWSGRPEESMHHWEWLARRGSEDARQEAIALSIALNDNDLEVKMRELQLERAKRQMAPRLLPQ
jgi:tetratricopeptide (TPR) repeat protein